MAAARPLTEPTDRSISPSSSTKTIPTEIMPVPPMRIDRSERFLGERKALSFHWKTAQMTAMPTITGTAPRSPLRILRTNSLR